jgi:hypothetical protein
VHVVKGTENSFFYFWGVFMETVCKCPKCGSQLETRKFVDSWNEKGEPVDVNEGLYCPKCGLRWSEEKVDENDFLENFGEKWFCRKCGSHEFKILTRAYVKDVLNRSGKKGWNYTELTMQDEEIHEVQCAKCGAILYEKCKPKPISKETWEDFWSSHILDFIVAFDHYVAHSEEEPEDRFGAYLQGIVRGMFAIHNLIESEMVNE